MLAQYTGTLLVVSHDRDFLDQTVSKVLAFEGDGNVRAVIGGYADYLAERDKGGAMATQGVEVFSASAATKKSLPSKPADTAMATPQIVAAAIPVVIKKRLTFTQQHELDKLPARITALETEMAYLQNELDDPTLYIRDADMFDELSRRFSTAAKTLAAAETRWLELEELAGK
jgi:ABC transport system ATP-binding/permease protein